MKTSKPPFIAAWLLDRFGADAQTDSIAGDLVEQYRLGRSRFWYWREVITAIIMGASSETIKNSRVVFRAVAGGWLLLFAFGYLAPYEISLVKPYLIDAPPDWLGVGWLRILLLVLLIEGPGVVLTGQIVARLGQSCRIPALFAFWASLLLWGAVTFWMNPEIYDVSALWLLPLQTILFLLSGGLLTGLPKRTVSTPKCSP